MATDGAQLNPSLPAACGSEALQALSVCHIDSGDLWAGAEVNTTTLLKTLVREPELRLSVILLNEGEMSQRLRNYGIEVKVIPESERSFFQILREATQFLRSRPVQILHSHRYKENLFAALLARRCRIPHLVCTRHGAPEPFHGWRQIKHTAIGSLDQLVAHHFADRVICVSDEMRSRLLRHLPAHKLLTIRTGIDTEQVRSALTKAEAKRRLGFSEQAKVVGYAGRLVPVKRIDIFLRAAKQLSQADPGISFVIAGDGPQATHLRACTRELDLDGRVQFLGSRKDIYDVMRAFDIFVLCSDHEGLPRSLLEALYLGVPVVSRSVGGVPEIVENGVTGLLVHSAEPATLANRCTELMADEDYRNRMAEAGPRFVARMFPAALAASQTFDTYRSLSRME